MTDIATTEFTKKNARPTATYILEVLRENFSEFEFEIGKIGYQDTEFSAKLTVRIAGTDNEYERAFKVASEDDYWGLEGLELGDWIVIAGREFKITGYNNRAKKNNLLIEDEQGKQYHCPTRPTMRDGSIGRHVKVLKS
tara:strand:+ start:60 stop:476 length:417 start_codon:yes stop_codon:yes gene_type:complete